MSARGGGVNGGMKFCNGIMHLAYYTQGWGSEEVLSLNSILTILVLHVELSTLTPAEATEAKIGITYRDPKPEPFCPEIHWRESH